MTEHPIAPMGTTIDRLLGSLRPASAEHRSAVTYELRDEDLDVDIPPEYRNATLSPKLRERLTSGAISVVMSGPSGTGKTYNVWGALRAHRRRRCGALVGTERSWFIRCDAPKRSDWVRRMVEPQLDRIRIVSESGHIQRHRFDREWLEEQATFAGLLAVDDIGYARGGDWPTEAVYHLANERRAHQRQTLWTTNLTPSQIRDAYSPAIASRLLGGVVLELEGDDRRLA